MKKEKERIIKYECNEISEISELCVMNRINKIFIYFRKLIFEIMTKRK